MMAEYVLSAADPSIVVHRPDHASFLDGSGSSLDLTYQAWLADGNAPDPPDPPPIVYGGSRTVDDTVRTTDDVLTEVFRFPTATKHVYRATFGMTAIDAASGACKDAEARMTFKRTGSGLAQVGSTAVLSSAQDAAAAAWAIQAAPSGTDLVVSVRGAVGRTIDWMLVGTIATYAPDGLGS